MEPNEPILNTMKLQSIVFIASAIPMFQTNILARHPILSDLAGEGLHVWSKATLALNRSWFFASFTRNFEEGTFIESAMLSSPGQVAELMNNKSLIVHEVQLVSPGWVNRTGYWQMEQLHSIWQGKSTNESFDVLMFRLVNGIFRFNCSKTINPSDLKDLICIAAIE